MFGSNTDDFLRILSVRPEFSVDLDLIDVAALKRVLDVACADCLLEHVLYRTFYETCTDTHDLFLREFGIRNAAWTAVEIRRLRLRAVVGSLHRALAYVGFCELADPTFWRTRPFPTRVGMSLVASAGRWLQAEIPSWVQ